MFIPDVHGLFDGRVELVDKTFSDFFVVSISILNLVLKCFLLWDNGANRTYIWSFIICSVKLDLLSWSSISKGLVHWLSHIDDLSVAIEAVHLEHRLRNILRVNGIRFFQMWRRRMSPESFHGPCSRLLHRF